MAGRVREKCQQHFCTILAGQNVLFQKGRKENVNTTYQSLETLKYSSRSSRKSDKPGSYYLSEVSVLSLRLNYYGELATFWLFNQY